MTELLRPWDAEYEVPESWEEEDAQYKELFKVVIPDEFVFAVNQADPDEHWSLNDSTIFVSITPKSYWKRTGYGWDQHLTGFIPEEDLDKLQMDESHEATFDYMGESVESCIAELTAYGMTHDPEWQKIIDHDEAL